MRGNFVVTDTYKYGKSRPKTKENIFISDTFLYPQKRFLLCFGYSHNNKRVERREFVIDCGASKETIRNLCIKGVSSLDLMNALNVPLTPADTNLFVNASLDIINVDSRVKPSIFNSYFSTDGIPILTKLSEQSLVSNSPSVHQALIPFLGNGINDIHRLKKFAIVKVKPSPVDIMSSKAAWLAWANTCFPLLEMCYQQQNSNTNTYYRPESRSLRHIINHLWTVLLPAANISNDYENIDCRWYRSINNGKTLVSTKIDRID